MGANKLMNLFQTEIFTVMYTRQSNAIEYILGSGCYFSFCFQFIGLKIQNKSLHARNPFTHFENFSFLKFWQKITVNFCGNFSDLEDTVITNEQSILVQISRKMSKSEKNLIFVPRYTVTITWRLFISFHLKTFQIR